MRLSSALVAIVGGVGGVAAAVAAYSTSSAVEEAPVGSGHAGVLTVGRPLPAAPPRIRVELAPCVAPARLEHGACVTRAVRTVVVATPASEQPAPGPGGTATVAAPTAGARRGSDDGPTAASTTTEPADDDSGEAEGVETSEPQPSDGPETGDY